MPYIQFDLEAKKFVPHVARALGTTDAIIAWGLLNLWEYSWIEGNAEVSEAHLDGFFGVKGAREPLNTFGFLDGLRVRGTDRYERITEARRKGGLAARKHLVPAAFQKFGSRGQPRDVSSAPAQEQPRQPRLFSSAPLGSLTDNREPRTEDTTKKTSGAEILKLTPSGPRLRKRSEGQKFFDSFQKYREEETGKLREKEPNPAEVNDWLSCAAKAIRVDIPERLEHAMVDFFEDEFWGKRGFPFRGFMSQYAKYVPPVERKEAAREL